MPIIFGDSKKKQGAAAAAPDGRLETGADSALKLLAQDIREAIQSGSDDDLVSALKAFYLECDSKPHMEGAAE